MNQSGRIRALEEYAMLCRDFFTGVAREGGAFAFLAL